MAFMNSSGGALMSGTVIVPCEPKSIWPISLFMSTTFGMAGGKLARCRPATEVSSFHLLGQNTIEMLVREALVDKVVVMLILERFLQEQYFLLSASGAQIPNLVPSLLGEAHLVGELDLRHGL